VLGLDGNGRAESFADYLQWESWKADNKQSGKGSSVTRTTDSPSSAQGKKKLSYLEAREYAVIEKRIADAEQVLRSKRAQLEDPTIATDAVRLIAAQAELEAAQKVRDALYARWVQLEEKSS
jgi:ATP-binding cassette subfamily F protein uup